MCFYFIIKLFVFHAFSMISNQAICMLERREKPTPDMFGELLQNASTMGDLRNCPVSIFSFRFWGGQAGQKTFSRLH